VRHDDLKVHQSRFPEIDEMDKAFWFRHRKKRNLATSWQMTIILFVPQVGLMTSPSLRATPEAQSLILRHLQASQVQPHPLFHTHTFSYIHILFFLYNSREQPAFVEPRIPSPVDLLAFPQSRLAHTMDLCGRQKVARRKMVLLLVR
jgi:hypothetical protein